MSSVEPSRITKQTLRNCVCVSVDRGTSRNDLQLCLSGPNKETRHLVCSSYGPFPSSSPSVVALSITKKCTCCCQSWHDFFLLSRQTWRLYLLFFLCCCIHSLNQVRYLLHGFGSRYIMNESDFAHVKVFFELPLLGI